MIHILAWCKTEDIFTIEERKSKIRLLIPATALSSHNLQMQLIIHWWELKRILLDYEDT